MKYALERSDKRDRNYAHRLDEAANDALLAALSDGPKYIGQLCDILHKSSQVIQQRLYRLERKGMVAMEGSHKGRRTDSKRWGLPGQVVTVKPAQSAKTPPRRLPDWRGSTLSYDLEAHRRLAMIGR